MRIDETSEDVWDNFLSEMEDACTKYEGRKYTYISDQEIKIFDKVEASKNKNFHLLSLKEMEKLQVNATFFHSLKLLIKANQLLEAKSPEKEELLLLVENLSLEGKTLQRSSMEKVCEKLLQKGEQLALKAKKYDDVHLFRSKLGTIRSFSSEHPMFDFQKAVKDQTKNQPVQTGAYFSRIDQGTVKQGAIRGDVRAIGNKTVQQATFKIAYPYRKELQEEMERLSSPDYQQNLKNRWKHSFEDVQINQTKETYYRYDNDQNKFLENSKLEIGEMTEVVFKGCGVVRFGNLPKVGCAYNKIQIEVEGDLKPGEFLERAQKMFTALGMGHVFQEGEQEDFKRQKYNLLFHQYYPKEAYEYENTRAAYDPSPQEVRSTICQLVPEMKEVFEKYEQSYDLFGTDAVYPGKKVFTVNDIPKKIRDNGGIGLMVGVSASGSTIAKRTVDLLEGGILSTEDRFSSGLLIEGASSSTDYNSGGGEFVFTRLVSDKQLKKNTSISEISFCGGTQILIDVDVTKRGGYGYSTDRYGRKNRFIEYTEHYSNRTPFWDLAKEMNDPEKTTPDNEVMIKNFVSPSYFRGIVVSNETMKKDVINEMRTRGLITIVNKIEMFNNKPVDQFIHISDKFSKEMWRK